MNRNGKAILRKASNAIDPPPDDPASTIADVVRRLLAEGFHGKVELSLHGGNVTMLNIESKIPFDKICSDNIICFKLS